jgi:hypothetical protein
MEPICLIATRLNPGLDPAEAIGEKEVNTVDRLICAALGGQATTPGEPAPNSPAKARPASRISEVYARAMKPGGSAQQTTSSPSQQFRHYLEESTFMRGQSTGPTDPKGVVEFWMVRREQWPELARDTLEIAARPVSSTDTERHFGLAGRIPTLRRVRMMPEHLEELALIMANDNVSETVVMGH